MIGNVGAAKQILFDQTTAEREEILTEPNNNGPNPLTPTLSPTGRGRRAPAPMSSSAQISLAAFATDEEGAEPGQPREWRTLCRFA